MGRLSAAGRLRCCGGRYLSPALVSAKSVFPEIKLLQCDVRSLPFPSDTFGVYMSLGVLEHFEDGPEEMLREARRVLRPHGLLFITVPLHTWLTEVAAVRRQKREGDAHFFQYLFSRRELKELLQDNGFLSLEMRPWSQGYTMRYLFPKLYEKAGQSWRDASGLDRANVLASKILRRVLDRAVPRGLCAHMQAAVAVAV